MYILCGGIYPIVTFLFFSTKKDCNSSMGCEVVYCWAVLLGKFEKFVFLFCWRGRRRQYVCGSKMWGGGEIREKAAVEATQSNPSRQSEERSDQQVKSWLWDFLRSRLVLWGKWKGYDELNLHGFFIQGKNGKYTRANTWFTVWLFSLLLRKDEQGKLFLFFRFFFGEWALEKFWGKCSEEKKWWTFYWYSCNGMWLIGICGVAITTRLNCDAISHCLFSFLLFFLGALFFYFFNQKKYNGCEGCGSSSLAFTCHHLSNSLRMERK